MNRIKVNTYIDDLVTVKSSDIPLIGSEAFNFSRLYNQEIKVPEAIALTTLAFDDYLVTTNATEQILNLLSNVQPFVRQTAKDASEQIVNIIMTNEIPKGIKNSLQTIFQTLVGSGNKSYIQLEASHVIDEKFLPVEVKDLAYYDINDFEDFISKIRLIWSSLFLTESIEFRTNKYYRGPITIAILARQMKKFEISGKAYSIPPITREPDMIEVTSNFGILDRTIDLEQSADSYKIDLHNKKIVEKTIMPQEFMLLRNGTQNGYSERKTKVEISKEWKRRQKLEDKYILELVDLLSNLEDGYSAPLEIEWGIEAGDLFVTDVEMIPVANKFEEAQHRELLKSFGTDKSELIQVDKEHSIKSIEDEIENVSKSEDPQIENKLNELIEIDSNKQKDISWPNWANKYSLVANTLLDISTIDANNIHAMSLFNGTYFDSTELIFGKKVLPEMIFENKGKLKTWLDAMVQSVSVAATNGGKKDFIYQFSNPLASELTHISVPDKFKQYYGDERFIQYPEALVSEVLILQMLEDHYTTPPIHVCLPYVRNVENLKDLKKILNSGGLTRSGTRQFFAEVSVPSFAYEIDEIGKDLIDGLIINYDVLLRISVYRSKPREMDHKTLSKLIKKIINDAKSLELKTYVKFTTRSTLALELISDFNPDGFIFSFMPSEEQIQIIQRKENLG
ncbi:hypothetical protein KC669_03130 [Candidatus Dojkabacteria bacterium]|uniref:Phosphoenolpyruvate synthase n=1 Tax=Candidatus Dojkabacteria bacterium TaxID=2099670 RepID=A0A955LAA1_9BACT|nr:hypothetical protein [Candidatus Dojkabacteria bacterium]